MDAMAATRRFGELMELPEPQVPLDEAALLIAAHAYPDLDLPAELARLDRLAESCRVPTLDGLLELLYKDLGFRGNRSDYFDPRNSYLNDVASRRLGIPISLAVVTMEVGRRVGVPVAGVGMPGHFLLRDRVDPAVFVDPFSGGVLMDRGGCLRLFHAVNGPDAIFDDSYLEPADRFAIVARLLANLKQVFGARRDLRSLAWVLELRCLVPGMPLEERREWAMSLIELGAYRRAADALEGAASQLPAETERNWLDAARKLRASLN